jgi:hypothetical protein
MFEPPNTKGEVNALSTPTHQESAPVRVINHGNVNHDVRAPLRDSWAGHRPNIMLEIEDTP